MYQLDRLLLRRVSTRALESRLASLRVARLARVRARSLIRSLLAYSRASPRPSRVHQAPDLHAHLASEGAGVASFAAGWLLPLFSGFGALDGAAALALWAHCAVAGFAPAGAEAAEAAAAAAAPALAAPAL